jgi:hypothetical protein
MSPQSPSWKQEARHETPAAEPGSTQPDTKPEGSENQ